MSHRGRSDSFRRSGSFMSVAGGRGRSDSFISVRGGGGGGGDDEAPPSAKEAAADAPPLSILTTPYLCDVCFGPDIAPHRTRVALAEAAVAGDADLPPSHPWLPQGEEPSQQSEVETKMARAKAMKEGAPRKVRLQLLRMSHAAMKGDLAAQMERVASGLQSGAR